MFDMEAGISMIVRFAVALTLVALAATHVAAQTGAITINSKHSVAETVDRLVAAIKAQDYAVFGHIDYQSISASQGGRIRPNQLVLFGRGRAVQSLLSTAPTLGLDLPLKILVWEAEDGSVRMTYNSAEFLQARHSAEAIALVLEQITKSTASFARKVAE